jgi:ATP-dependent DNA helicase
VSITVLVHVSVSLSCADSVLLDSRFAPTIPVLLYQGTVAERKELRFNHLGLPRQNGASRPVDPKDLPVIICTYGIAINDQKYLTKLKYMKPTPADAAPDYKPEYENMYECLIVDEAHRLKNMECRLIRSLREYPSKHRFLLTGTPLQNNLEELYSLLSFIMPDVFQSLEVFSKDFDFKALTSTDADADNTEAQELVGQLHAILKAFILRRLKKDVVKDLPLKKEYVISAPLTAEQKELYDAILHKTLHSHLQAKTEANSAATSETEDDAAELTNTGRKARKSAVVGRKSYAEQSEEAFLEEIENGTFVTEDEPDLDASTRLAEAQVKKLADRKINAMSLRNILMQLRKVANHPDLLLKPEPHDPETAQRLVSASGKMLLLERLMTALFKDKRKVLLFSQFTSMLDIIHDWAESIGQIVYRIDGTTKTEDRQDQMWKFNADWHDDNGGVCNLFLLSTRAGGVGVNLTGADTVILFDSDWNPQQDLQAMDRSHRIGQKNNVLVFRLITETVERKILERATAKRKLETLVIGSGDFKGDNFAFQGSKVKRNKDDTIANLALQLLKIEGEKVELAEKGQTIMSDEQISGLLDRSQDAMLSKAAWSAEGGVGVDVMETVAPVEDETGEPDLFGSLLEPDEEEGVAKIEDDTGAIQ